MEINGVSIGPGCAPYIIAEISCNHVYTENGPWGAKGQSYERCEKLIHAAAKAGCHAVKLQTYLPETITLDCDKKPFQISGANVDLWNRQTLFELYKKNYTPWEWTPKLMDLANSLGMALISTPFDESAVDFLEECNIPAYKIASFESTDHLLLKKVAKTGKPVILSMGMNSEEDLLESLSVLKESGDPPIAILHCTSAYPAKASDAHIKAIPYITSKWGVTSGLSDHTPGIAVSLGAIALGASIIEKHIILGHGHPTADAPFSITPEEFKKLLIQGKIIYESLGSVQRAFALKEEEQLCHKYRRSLFVVKDMKKGEIFEKGVNVRSIRPANGLHTRHIEEIIGKAASQDIEYGTPLNWDLIETANRVSCS